MAMTDATPYKPRPVPQPSHPSQYAVGGPPSTLSDWQDYARQLEATLAAVRDEARATMDKLVAVAEALPTPRGRVFANLSDLARWTTNELVAVRQERDALAERAAYWEEAYRTGFPTAASWKDKCEAAVARLAAVEAGLPTRDEVKALVREHLGCLFDDYAAQCGLDEEFDDFAAALLTRLRATLAPERRCGCTVYNGGPCYNCLNNAHSICDARPRCGAGAPPQP